jgi:Tannase and feruloyl esterase
MASYRRRACALVALLALALLAAGLVDAGRAPAKRAPAAHAALANLPVVTPKLTCDAVRRLDVSQAVGAGTGITSTQLVTPANSYPYCDVKGVIAPQIQFEVQLPTQTYRQRYLQTGCGGLCGTLAINAQQAAGCIPLTEGDFAIASDNQGHVNGGTQDGNFGTDRRLRVDFAWRADHKTALAAKALIRAFYGSGPRYSYWDGCSQGGHEGLTEAQRFPHDFDGIVAGAPASITTELNSFYQPWLATVDTGSDGKPILTADKLPALHQAVLANCDAKDGLTDGQIDDPRACTFDPASLTCTGADSPSCLTPAQVAVVRKIYSGPVDSRGERLYPGGEAMGSELAWAGWMIPVPPQQSTQRDTISWSIGNGWVKYLAFRKNPPLWFTAADIRFNRREFRRVERLAGLYDATDPDLTAFRNHGGKLIIYHGWADQAISPYGTIAYYQALRDQMGGLRATQRFARLFMVPGMFHCRGGAAPNSFDMLTPVMRWVEDGVAPRRVVATDPASGRTRPLFPYPRVARYDGSGSTDDASNFVAARPPRRFDDHIPWLGSFRPHREIWR